MTIREMYEEIERLEADQRVQLSLITKYKNLMSNAKLQQEQCSGVPSKKWACHDALGQKILSAERAKNQANSVYQLNKKSLESLRVDIRAQQAVNVTLAGQGKTGESVNTVAEGEADRLREIGVAEAEVVLEIGEEKAIDEKNKTAMKKQAMTIVISISLVIAIAIGVIVYRKFIKKKK